MSCAVFVGHLENFKIQAKQGDSKFTEDNMKKIKKRDCNVTRVPEVNISPDCSKIKSTESESMEKESSEKGKKKKKKWKKISLIETGFNLSLFPRPQRPERLDPEEEERIFQSVVMEMDDVDMLIDKLDVTDVTVVDTRDGKMSKKNKYTRPDKTRKIMKASKQVKDKYCTSLKNNDGRKKLFIHHRLFKLINLEEKRLYLHLPSRTNLLKTNEDVINNRSTNETRSRLKPAAPERKPAPVQNLHHSLHQSNAPADLDAGLLSLLITLQHRDLTPEDYDTLLRLDETVAPKTIDKAVLNLFKTDVVTEETSGELCAICFDPYTVGEHRKFLPCEHVFHEKCIDMWLENSSRNCPIDGLPVDE